MDDFGDSECYGDGHNVGYDEGTGCDSGPYLRYHMHDEDDSDSYHGDSFHVGHYH